MEDTASLPPIADDNLPNVYDYHVVRYSLSSLYIHTQFNGRPDGRGLVCREGEGKGAGK